MSSWAFFQEKELAFSQVFPIFWEVEKYSFTAIKLTKAKITEITKKQRPSVLKHKEKLHRKELEWLYF